MLFLRDGKTFYDVINIVQNVFSFSEVRLFKKLDNQHCYERIWVSSKTSRLVYIA